MVDGVLELTGEVKGDEGQTWWGSTGVWCRSEDDLRRKYNSRRVNSREVRRTGKVTRFRIDRKFRVGSRTDEDQDNFLVIEPKPSGDGDR